MTGIVTATAIWTHMRIELLLAFTLLTQTSGGSEFNRYASHLAPIAMDAACGIQDRSYLGNLAYQFRAKAYPGRRVLQFKDGRFDDVGVLSGADIEWSTELERQESIVLGRDRAVLLVFFANHRRGSGSASHVMVLRCTDEHLEIVFEAGGEGVRASHSGAGDLEIAYPFWRRADSHVSPSRLINERYRWDVRSGRFVLIGLAGSERKTP